MARTLHEAVLGKQLVKQGFTLEEDEDFAYLKLNGNTIGTYNAYTVTIGTLRYDAVLALNEQEKQRR